MSRIKGLIDRVGDFYRWIDDRFKATALASIRVSFPPTFSYVLSNLGMATVVCFLVTVATGLPLLIYYRPSPWNVAYDSIKFITEEVAFGALLRGVHYHASNGMVFLAVVHAVYVFFKRLYKGRFDFLWVTGVLLAVLTVLAAFTGYVLIFNDRAVEAQNIMLGITDAIHPLLKALMAGTGLSDRAMRLYAFHIAIIPTLILALLSVHLPRALRISVPMIIGIFAALFIATGIYPAELGPKYDPAVTPQFMPPEWYFLWVFTLLRTWAPVVYVGVLIPGIWVVLMMIAPWVDTGRRPRLTDRPHMAIIGISSIAYWIYLTLRGLIGVGPPAEQVPPYEVLGVLIAIVLASGIVFRLITPMLKRRTRTPRRGEERYLTPNVATALLLAIVGVQAVLVWAFANAYVLGDTRLVSFDIGLILLGLGMSQHIYATASKQPLNVKG
jgi:quinol-cytochrome oxidoreductase complex cytochrome b subunit